MSTFNRVARILRVREGRGCAHNLKRYKKETAGGGETLKKEKK